MTGFTDIIAGSGGETCGPAREALGRHPWFTTARLLYCEALGYKDALTALHMMSHTAPAALSK